MKNNANRGKVKKKSIQPDRLEKSLVEAGIIAIRISVIAVGFSPQRTNWWCSRYRSCNCLILYQMASLLQGVARALNVGYDTLN